MITGYDMAYSLLLIHISFISNVIYPMSVCPISKLHIEKIMFLLLKKLCESIVNNLTISWTEYNHPNTNSNEKVIQSRYVSAWMNNIQWHQYSTKWRHHYGEVTSQVIRWSCRHLCITRIRPTTRGTSTYSDAITVKSTTVFTRGSTTSFYWLDGPAQQVCTLELQNTIYISRWTHIDNTIIIKLKRRGDIFSRT